LRNESEIVVGVNKRKETDFTSVLKIHLTDKSIICISHFETGYLIIEFDEQYYFDLFADSSVFEQYQLYF